MKKTSLIAIMFITLASCSKEELNSNSSNKTEDSNWIVTKKGVVVQKIKCDELTNRNTKQVIYKQTEINSNSNAKEAQWTHSARLDANGHVQCDGLKEKNCLVLTDGGVVIEKNKPIPSDK